MYIQRSIPSPNKRFTFSLQNFAGGLNNRSELLGPSEASDLLNMKFSNDTVMEKRKGSVKVDELKLDGPITFVGKFKPYKEADVVLRATDTKLYAGTTEITTLKGRMMGVNFMGKFIFVDGEKIRVFGRFPQKDTTYEKVIGTPVDTNVLMELVKTPEGYTQLDQTHVRGVARYDYTNKKMWYEPCKLEVEDTYQGTNVLPDEPKYVVVHKGRLFISGADKDDDNVFLSDLNNPYYFPVYLPIQLPPNSDKVRGLHVFDDSVVVGRQFDMFAITGITNRTDIGGEPFRLKKLNTHTGFASNRAVSTAHNYLFYFGADGHAYMMSNVRAESTTLITQVLSQQVDIKIAPIDLKVEDFVDASATFYDNIWYVTVKDKVLLYSYSTRTWSMYNALNARSFYVDDLTLTWGNQDGYYMKHSEDYMDDGVPFTAFWKSSWFDMDDANSVKFFREFYLVAHTFEEVDSDIRVTFEIDYIDVKDEVMLKNQISVWGKAKFGDKFITRRINESIPFVIGRHGRSIRFTFTNGYILGAPVNSRSELDAYESKRESTIVLIKNESLYVRYTNGKWEDVDFAWINQGMKIYQMNGDYEYRGKR